ncbi:MAG TPA: SDR family oxidoreductase [Clostridiaceae bacterium]|nr:SDR family oxidoreductase [Clostridiaceae bacterium]
MISIDLTDKQAIVTGAGKGIGRQVAITLAEAGADIIVADIDKTISNKTVQTIKKIGRKAEFKYCDISKLSDVQDLVNYPSKLDIFVNVAGIVLTTGLLDSSIDDIKRLFDVNIIGTSNAYRCALERMIPQKYGKIVTMSSSAGREGGPIHAFYRASKAAVINLNQSAAMTAAPHNINVNTICPGIIYTDMWKDILEGFVEETGNPDKKQLWDDYVKKSIPMGKAQTVEDIANGVLFLCSSLADSITAQAINICGGMCQN